MIARCKQFHQYRNKHRQEAHNQLGVQTRALRDFINQTVETFLAEKVLKLLQTNPRLGKIGDCLLNGSLAIVLLLCWLNASCRCVPNTPRMG